MRRTAWVLLILFVFAIPWEYSLDLGAPFGNIARVLGLIAAVVGLAAILLARQFRAFSGMHWMTLALFGWCCCSYFWTVAPESTATHLRGYAQEMMLLWLVWEFVETAANLRVLLRAWLAGSWILAILTIAGFSLAVSGDVEQIRFAAFGQDPNDVARFLDFGFPVAALLLREEEGWRQRAFLLGYVPVGFAGVLLTASRSGVLVGVVALAGCGVMALHRNRRGAFVGLVAVVVTAVTVFELVPVGTLDRIGTVAEVVRSGDLNQRVNIWWEGWRAFERAPVLGSGAGSFVVAAGVAPEDTAHNTVLAILVELGLCGLVFATGIVVIAARAILRLPGTMRVGAGVMLSVWALSSLVGTVGENRTTWLLFGIIAAGARVAEGHVPRPIVDDGPELDADVVAAEWAG